MAAYVIARYDFKLFRWMKKLYIVALFFPVAFKIVPLFMLLGKIHLLDSLLGLVLAYSATTIPFTIFNFMSYWNEYIMALSFITTESKRTLTLGIAYLMEVQRYATDWGALFACPVIVMILTLVLYALLQRKITAGINVGGLKG